VRPFDPFEVTVSRDAWANPTGKSIHSRRLRPAPPDAPDESPIRCRVHCHCLERLPEMSPHFEEGDLRCPPDHTAIIPQHQMVSLTHDESLPNPRWIFRILSGTGAEVPNTSGRSRRSRGS
jgi:hypothetical protein